MLCSRIILTVFMLFTIVQAGAALMMVEPGVPYLNNGNLAFGDYDNDGDLDIITVGSHRLNGIFSTQSRLFRNDGNWLFSPTDFQFGSFIDGDASWGDYDKDGWLDVAISGSPNIASVSGSMQLFHNDQGQGFTPVDYEFHDRSQSCHQWADMDNDFDMDLVCTGSNITLNWLADLCIYDNLGGGEFSHDPLPGLGDFAAIPTCYLRTTDFNRDGYHDISVSGAKSYGGYYSPMTMIWQQLPGGGYSSLFNYDLYGGGGLCWFDYDVDNDLDLVYNGYKIDLGDVTTLLLNMGNFYSNTLHSFPNTDGAMEAADYDNDGDDDIFITGGISMSCVASVFANDGDGSFALQDYGLHPLGETMAFWVDLDNDCDLDLAYTGRGMDDATMFYRNDGSVPNQAPTPPLLSYIPVSGFSFSGATDSETPQLSLTYDLRIGTSPGAADFYCPPADLITGFRRIAGPGRPDFSAYRLPEGRTYYASAQSIDGAFMGSAWSPELVIDLEVAAHDELQIPAVQVYPNPCSESLNLKAAGNERFTAEIFNIRGQKLANLNNVHSDKGEMLITWNGFSDAGTKVSSGIYLVRISFANHIQTHRILLLR